MTGSDIEGNLFDENDVVYASIRTNPKSNTTKLTRCIVESIAVTGGYCTVRNISTDATHKVYCSQVVVPRS